uniref:Dysbindin-like n=1 Tax=Fundulus heteroclitus TaxID=8078 RepID=A0A3Q2Q776_FUNHE
MKATEQTGSSKRRQITHENSQSLLDNDSAQHLKLRDRQRFFEDTYQHDMDNYLPSTHLQVDCRKPPMGSISSMEVNVDTLEQMDLMDISDQEALDVFLNSGSVGDEGALASPLPGSQRGQLSVLCMREQSLILSIDKVIMERKTPLLTGRKTSSRTTLDVNGHLPRPTGS